MKVLIVGSGGREHAIATAQKALRLIKSIVHREMQESVRLLNV